MKYILDTNICIYLMKRQPPEVRRRFEALRVGDVFISAITLAELEHGADADPTLASSRRRQLDAFLRLVPALPFDAAAARQYGRIRNARKALGRNRFDTLIAAQAMASGRVLVTNNEADFSDIEGLSIENWVAGA